MNTSTGPRLFSLETAIGLRLAAALGLPLAEHEERVFEDGEHKIRPLESIRDRDVYLLAPLHGDDTFSANDRLVRALFFLGALRDAGARRLTAILPYLCYSRKDSRTKARDPVATRYVASMFEAIGVDRVVSSTSTIRQRMRTPSASPRNICARAHCSPGDSPRNWAAASRS